MKSTQKKRIIAGISANLFGQGAMIFMQLASLPIYLHFWGVKTYGEWLILSAFPVYLAMVDIGILPTASNRMTMALGAGRHEDANKIFQSSLVFIIGILSIFFIFALLASIFFPFPKLFDNFDSRAAFLFLSLTVLLNLFGGLPDMIFKSTDEYAFGTVIGNILRLAEWIGAMVGLVMIGTFSAVALSGLIIRFCGTLIIVYISAKNIYRIKWRFKDWNRLEIHSMIKPALAFMVFPVANALTFQGMTILAGLLLGPLSVTIFNTYRTIARVSVQINSILSHALWPEFSKLFGMRDGGVKIKKLFMRSFWIGIIIAIISCSIVYILSPFLLNYWSRNAINYNNELMVIMIIYAVIASSSHVPKVFLMSTNQHINLAYYYLIYSVVLILLAAFIGTYIGLIGFAISMVLSDIFMFFFSIYLCHKFLLKII